MKKIKLKCKKKIDKINKFNSELNKQNQEIKKK